MMQSHSTAGNYAEHTPYLLSHAAAVSTAKKLARITLSAAAATELREKFDVATGGINR